MRNRLFMLATLLLLVLAPALPAHAIVDGVPDEGEHPYVGQLLFHVPDEVDPRFDEPGAWFSCSGSLVDASTVVTAGHCTHAVGLDGESTLGDGGDGGNDVWISLEEEPEHGILPASSTFAPGNNAGRYAAWAAALDDSSQWHRATSYPHTDYDPSAFFEHDLGVLELEEPVTMSTYGALPRLGLLDELAKVKGQVFTPVGYGLEEAGPNGSSGGDTRRKATVRLVSLSGVYGTETGVAAKFSSNNGTQNTGGTCFGDSGGPILVAGTNTLTSVTSFGIDPNCASGGGAYRLDQPDDLAFLDTFGVQPAA